MVAKTVAVLDACVLYPPYLRDLLLELAYRGSIGARWTAEIQAEWSRNLLANRPGIDAEKLDRLQALMNSKIPGCLVTGHLPLIPALTLPDPDDRHVLAAAIHSGAGAIVTFNLRDFPAGILGGHRVIASHPDDFLVERFEDDPDAFRAAVVGTRQRFKNPAFTVLEYLAILERQGLTRTVDRLREFIEIL